MEELQGILERFAGSGWELIALPSRRWLDGQENREELVRALQRAQQICGNLRVRFGFAISESAAFAGNRLTFL